MRKNYYFPDIALSILLSAVSIFGQTAAPSNPAAKTVPAANASAYSLTIENEDGKQTRLPLADIIKLKRQTVKADDHGTAATYEGVALVEVLKLAGIEFGENMRGKRLATFLLVEAADKYQVVFAMAELDPGFTDKVVILADRRDGQALPEKEGVLRIIVPDEKRQGRWVRQVVGLKIMRAGSPVK